MPGRGDVWGAVGMPGCGCIPGICGGCAPFGATVGVGGIPGYWLTTGFCSGWFGMTLIGSSLSSIGCGGRWNVGGGAALATAAGAWLVAMIVMRSYIDALAMSSARGAAMYPLAERSRISSASFSGMSTSCSVTAGPFTLSMLRIFD